MDIASVVGSLQRTLASADALLSDPGLRQAAGDLPGVLRSLKRTLDTTNREVGHSSAALQETLASVRTLATTLNRDSASTLAALRHTLENADATLEGAHALVDPRGHNAMQVQRAVDDLAATSARLRNLAERVDRDPSVLVRGR